MYVCGPDGSPYGFTNDHEPADIHRFMNQALARYTHHPPAPVIVSDAEKNAPFSITPPADVQVFQVFARIPHPPKTCSVLNQGVGRDFLWVYPEERKALVTQAGKANGQAFPLPETLLWRIARFHLVDDVRGTPDMWAAGAVQHLQATCHAIKTANGDLRIDLQGKYALANRRQGNSGTLEGDLEINPTTTTIGRFRVLANGHGWGTGTFTPNSPPGKFPLTIAIVDTTNPAARFVPPEEVATANNDHRYRHSRTG
jgi:hypothetical protein